MMHFFEENNRFVVDIWLMQDYKIHSNTKRA
jgi:hypothetical protein